MKAYNTVLMYARLLLGFPSYAAMPRCIGLPSGQETTIFRGRDFRSDHSVIPRWEYIRLSKSSGSWSAVVSSHCHCILCLYFAWMLGLEIWRTEFYFPNSFARGNLRIFLLMPSSLQLSPSTSVYG